MEVKIKKFIIYALSVWEFLHILYTIPRTIWFIHFDYFYCWTNYSGGVYLSLVCIYSIDINCICYMDLTIVTSVSNAIFAENKPINRIKHSIVTNCQQSERYLFFNRKFIDREPTFFWMLYISKKKAIQSNFDTRTLNKAVLY